MGESSYTSNSDVPPPRRSWKRYPLAALVAVFIIGALELFVILQSDLFTDGIYWTTLAKRDILADRADPEDVLVFGDSRAFSIQPALVSDALGEEVKVANYSWAYMGADAYDYFLDAYLRYNAPPRLILVTPMIEIVAVPRRMVNLEESPIYRTRLFTALPSSMLFDRFAEDGNWNLAGNLARHRAMPPSLHRRNQVWGAMKSLASGRGFPQLSDLDLHQIEGMQDRGAYLMHLTHVVTQPFFEQAERLYGPYGVHDNQEARAAYERFLSRAQAHDIEVRVLGIPVPEWTYDRHEEVGALTAYGQLLDQWSQRFPNFEVIEPVFVRWPNERFGDAGHLNLSGDHFYQHFYREALKPHTEL